MQRADAEDFARIERLNLGFADGDDSDRFAGGGEDFQRVARLLIGTTGMVLGERGNISALETMGGQIGGEGDAGVEFVIYR